VSGVSADGTVVAGFCDSVKPNPMYRWTRTTGFQSLPYLTNATDCGVQGISGDGNFVGGYCNLATGSSQPVRWSGTSAPVNVGLAGYPGGQISSLNTNGTAMTGVLVAALANGHNGAGLWRTGMNPVPINNVTGADSSFGNAISADGSTIVGNVQVVNATGYPGPRAFRWAQGGMMTLVPLPGGGSYSYASSVSTDGNKVCGSSDATGPSGTVKGYVFNVMTNTLTTLIEPSATYAAHSPVISDDGTTVAGSGDTGGWISTNLGTPVLLANVLAGFGVDLTGLVIDGIVDLSADGKVVVGSVYDGTTDNGFVAVVK
jgi:uncharacterized membrane protein